MSHIYWGAILCAFEVYTRSSERYIMWNTSKAQPNEIPILFHFFFHSASISLLGQNVFRGKSSVNVGKFFVLQAFPNQPHTK